MKFYSRGNDRFSSLTCMQGHWGLGQGIKGRGEPPLPEYRGGGEPQRGGVPDIACNKNKQLFNTFSAMLTFQQQKVNLTGRIQIQLIVGDVRLDSLSQLEHFRRKSLLHELPCRLQLSCIPSTSNMAASEDGLHAESARACQNEVPIQEHVANSCPHSNQQKSLIYGFLSIHRKRNSSQIKC